MKIDNGLIMLDDKHCAGYLCNLDRHGIFSADSKVEVTKEQADEHNRLLSEAQLLGIDQNYRVGQYGTFYLGNGAVITWTGEEVSRDVTIHGKSITFRRNGKTYRGRMQKDAGCSNFRRVA